MRKSVEKCVKQNLLIARFNNSENLLQNYQIVVFFFIDRIQT